MALGCANCGNVDLSHGLDRADCLECGATTDYSGKEVGRAQDIVTGGVNPIRQDTSERKVEKEAESAVTDSLARRWKADWDL